MKLVDLNAEFIGAGGPGITDKDGNEKPERHGVGVILECPCGACGRHLYVPFANPLDGGPAVDSRTGWQRTGDTLETLTLRPSVLRREGCKWHGFITDGEAKSC